MSPTTYAYKRMPFGLCNAPATFQQCMIAIFQDMLETSMEVFMGDFFVFGDSFDSCFVNLEQMLIRFFDFNKECIEAFEALKEKLTNAPIMVSLDWSEPFQLMCDASDFVIGVLPVVDAKSRLIQWILLLQEFDIKIKNKKGAKNVTANNLLRVENPNLEELRDEDINDNFPNETLMNVSSNDEDKIPWFADFANYPVGKILRKRLTYAQRCKFFSELKHYFWDEQYLFKMLPDRIIRRCVYGPFPKSRKFEYILVAIDYVSKWAEDEALPTNDARVVINFLKKLFSRFGILKDLISDRAYHPQTSSQVENTNRALKRILEKMVKDNPSVWSRKLDDALRALRST
ncbi:reverse transcriptase domain-containing protein [Tanacetum coccineum]